MGNGDNRSHFFGTIVSCLLCALSLFARREHFAAFIDVISRQSEDVPVVIADESQGQVHRPERVNQCTCPYDPTKGILILSIKITK